MNNDIPHLKSQKNQYRKAALGRPAIKSLFYRSAFSFVAGLHNVRLLLITHFRAVPLPSFEQSDLKWD